MPAGFAFLLLRYPRIAIAGGPGTGKTTLASHVRDRPVIHTDDFATEAWAEIPSAVLAEVARAGDTWCVEGCLVARALRKGLRPDVVIVLERPRIILTPRQEIFTKGITTILREVRRGTDLPFITPREETNGTKNQGDYDA